MHTIRVYNTVGVMLRTDDAGRRTMDAGPSTPYCKLTGELKRWPSLKEIEFLSVGVSYGYRLGARRGRLPSLIYQILFLSDMSYELFELFATELKFLDRN